jgi:hypothetical protein
VEGRLAGFPTTDSIVNDVVAEGITKRPEKRRQLLALDTTANFVRR